MKLVVKADDYGYTKTYNDGTLEAVENGIVTIVDLMLDTPGVEDAIERIKDYPWISVGWHGSHFWGSPVADPKLLPSMVDPETGKFRFRKDSSLKKEVKYEEAYIECKAEMEKCIKLLGRVPDIARVRDDSELELARKAICDEYGINYTYEQKIKRLENGSHPYAAAETKDPAIRATYDPVQYITSCPTDLDYAITVWHPGYLDGLIANESSFKEVRPMDVAALCSPEIKQWIIDNQIELVNIRDALYGTRDYQYHLKSIGSPLYVGK